MGNGHEQLAVKSDAGYAAPSAVGGDEWQLLEWQLMVLALEAEEEEEGASSRTHCADGG